MKNNDKVRVKRFRVGDPSAKYAYDHDGSQFEADLKAAEERAAYLWAEFIEFMKIHEVNPRELRSMFTRYYEEFLQ